MLTGPMPADPIVLAVEVIAGICSAICGYLATQRGSPVEMPGGETIDSLIVHLPGDRRAGARVAALTQTTDLMPTFLDYFQAPMPPHMHATSLRPALEGDQAVHDYLPGRLRDQRAGQYERRLHGHPQRHQTARAAGAR